MRLPEDGSVLILFFATEPDMSEIFFIGTRPNESQPTCLTLPASQESGQVWPGPRSLQYQLKDVG
jgi:hypothetical protein